jgi:hypothetical protein
MIILAQRRWGFDEFSVHCLTIFQNCACAASFATLSLSFLIKNSSEKISRQWLSLLPVASQYKMATFWPRRLKSAAVRYAFISAPPQCTEPFMNNEQPHFALKESN